MYTYNAKVIRVVDGDSVWLEVDVGFHVSYRYNFRLADIDTPELRSSDPVEKAKAYAAKERLEQLLPVGSQVIVESLKPGKYGRWITRITTRAGTQVNTTMITEGHAVPY